MKHLKWTGLVVATVASVALAEGTTTHTKQTSTETTTTTSQLQNDWSKAGPWTRKPADEQKVKDDINAFLKQNEQLHKARNLNAMLGNIDFPIFMATDNSKGEVKAKEYNRDEYSSMMKPMVDKSPADLKVTHKPNITVLSDSLAQVNDDQTITPTTRTTRRSRAAC